MANVNLLSNLLGVLTVSNLFALEVVQKCQRCQLCVLWENSIESHWEKLDWFFIFQH